MIYPRNVYPAIALLLTLVSLSFSWAARTEPTELELYNEQEAYQVYAALFRESVIWWTTRAEALVIQEETTGGMDDECLPRGKKFGKEFRAAVANYKKLNQSPRRLVASFPLERRYELVSKDEVSKIFKEGGWEDFGKRFPGSQGYIELSAVGFNPGKTKAVVYIGHSCGLLCGEGRFYLLEKLNGEWRLSETEFSSCMWAS